MREPVLVSADRELAAVRPPAGESRLRRWLTGYGLLAPAVIISIIFSFIPLGYIILVSFTRESTFFQHHPQYTTDNYREIWDRYMPHVYTTVRLATLSSLFDLIFGFPFAYILVRKISYRGLVRTLMVFPLFGPLYLAFGLYYVLLPNGTLYPVLEFLGIKPTDLLYSEPMTVFGMALFTFPFMTMNVAAALSNIDPVLEEAAQTLGANPFRVFQRILAPLSWPGILAGFLMCFGWNLGVYVVPILLGGTPQQRVLSLTLQQKATVQFDYGLASAMGIVLLAMAFTVTWGIVTILARSIGRMSKYLSMRTLITVLQHAYIWIWLALFALPFIATALHSFEAPGGGYSTIAYSDALGSFKDSLILSVELTVLAILINLLIAIPAAFAIVRHEIPGKRLILSGLNLSLYTPAAVMGLGLAITYAYLLDIPRTRIGLVAAYVVGTFPLMLVPIIVALRDQPLIYGEAARTLGANRLKTFIRVELPLLGPGISAGVLMTFVIVFNEFLVTLFIAGPETETAALRVYNLTKTAGFAQSTAALATIMQATSFIVVLLFFKLFSQRYLKGTYFT